MLWLLLLSVIANALLTLGVCWLLFRNGEVIEAARMSSRDEVQAEPMRAKQVERWLNSNRDLVAVVDHSGETSEVRFCECVFVMDHGELMIQTTPSEKG